MATDLEKRVRRLLTLRKIYAPYEGEDAEICSWLKRHASSVGNFQETVEKLGKVKISAPKPERFKGKTWELDVEAFMKAAKPTRDSLIKRGLVKEVDEYSGAYYGAVTVELFS